MTTLPVELTKDKAEPVMDEDPPDAGDEDDEDMEEGEEDDEEEEEGDDSVTHGRRSGRGLTLMTLLKEKVLQPGQGNMTINYLGNKFKGDLLVDGRIRSQETGKVFGTPSAWAIYCKQIVNPNKKSGCGWASVKYRGKKLDEYKNNWNRQKRLEYEREGDDMECGGSAAVGGDVAGMEVDDGGSGSDSDGDHHDHEIIEFDMLHTRHDPPYAGNPLVELTSFSTLGRLQPFTVAVSSSAMAVIDLHVHLTRAEALGFLAGQWDVNNHNLIVSHAFPLCCEVSTSDPSEAPLHAASAAGVAAEAAIQRQMASLKLALVGWYHSHPHSAPLPSLRDVDAQLEYEMKMKGNNDASYTPCIAFVVSPFNDSSGRALNRSSSSSASVIKAAYVVPPTTAAKSTVIGGSGTPVPVVFNAPLPTTVAVKDSKLDVSETMSMSVDNSDVGVPGGPNATSENTDLAHAKTSASIDHKDNQISGATTNAKVENSTSITLGLTTTTITDAVKPQTSSLVQSSTPTIKTTISVTKSSTSIKNSNPVPKSFPASKNIAPCVKNSIVKTSTRNDSSPKFGLTAMNAFWVMPPPEHRPHEYPRPMTIIYNVVQDAFVPKEALLHMRECVKFYVRNDDAINLMDTFAGAITYWDKLKMAIKARVPRDHYLPLIEYLHKILRITLPLPELLLPPSPVPAREPLKEKLPQELISNDGSLGGPLSPGASGMGSMSSASLNALVLKGREAGVDITSVRASSSSSRSALASATTHSDTRARPYPDPSKIHPLLVDRSDERSLQPMLLDRSYKSSVLHPLISDQSTSKVAVHQIISDQTDLSKQAPTRNSSSPGIPLPATQNPPDYPFPLLREMMVEQVSNMQKQQEQRFETDMTMPKDKQLHKSMPRPEGNLTLGEKELLMQISEKYLQQQRLQLQEQLQWQQQDPKAEASKLKSSPAETKIQSVASLFPQLSASVSLRPEPNPPSYSASQISRNGDQSRGSPPPYPSFSSKHRDLSIFPTPTTIKSDSQKKDFLARSTNAATSSSATISFSHVNLLSSNSTASGSSESSGAHKVTITATSGSPSSTPSASVFSNSPSFSITAVNRDSPGFSAPHLTPLSSPSLSIAPQPNSLSSSSPISLPGLSPVGAALFSSGVVIPPSASPSPLSSGLTPTLSPSPISFNPPRNNSPSLSVEVSPRHTEWAQNALPGMARPPLISVKSQAALSQPPFTHVSSVASTSAAATVGAASELPSFTSDSQRSSSSESVLTPANFAEAMSSGTVSPDQWMQASLAAGFSQFAGFAGFNKSSAQFSADATNAQHFPPPQYRPHGGSLSFLPSASSEQQHQDHRK
ncbi:uncharacterized protein LOC108676688 isoform X2 [Hyalella azteca]|uniref:Uncharacterized protein LOC108676688 isoform X2 n=1 Tax=Hyalella azteca TaxID=294128 RepID=A0A8B7P2P9_HYAAZ|nr:uncharacterized protein LOC108676688 isoform X2 [Hyalella azteca]